MASVDVASRTTQSHADCVCVFTAADLNGAKPLCVTLVSFTQALKLFHSWETGLSDSPCESCVCSVMLHLSLCCQLRENALLYVQ